VLSYRDHGDAAHACDYPREGLIGCNVAFEKAFLIECGGFEPRLGRRGNRLLGNEEVALMNAIQARGGKIFYEPRAVVTHLVHRERVSLRWLLRRSYDQGQSDIMMDHLYGRRSSRSGGGSTDSGPNPRGALVRVLALVRSGRRDEMVLALMDWAWRLGNITQSLKMKLTGSGRRPTPDLIAGSGKDLMPAD
jgi:hypothetical protein